MPRFVLLLHDCPDERPRSTHCDLMFETGAVLQTWALTELPAQWRILETLADYLKFSDSSSVSAERLADHRLAYLDYEGPVSGERGQVRRLDAGEYSELEESLTYLLEGQLIRGVVTLRQDSHGDARRRLMFTDP